MADKNELSHQSLMDATDVTGLQGRVRLQKGVTASSETKSTRDGTWMDRERKNLQAYEYLCHVGEAKQWIEACTKEKIAEISSLEEDLRNGIVLAKLAKSFAPKCVGKIFEDTSKLQYRHSDNIIYLLNAMAAVGLPEVFFFETLDLYEKKNIPKVIYCIHALSHLLSRLGLAPRIKDLLGKLQFTDEELEKTNKSLEGVPMPQFANVASALATEMPKDPREQYFEDNIEKLIKCQAVARCYIARRNYMEAREDIITCQAQVRMHQARKAHQARLKYWKDNESAVILAQAHWKGLVQRRKYQEKLQRFKNAEALFVKVQAKWRGMRQRNKYNKRSQFFRDHLDAIVKIQAKWKAKHMEKAYKAISSLDNPPISTLQEFLHLLDDSDNDFAEELELERLRQLVVKRIRENIQNDAEVNELDIKISLLVKNRISLEEVVQTTTKKKKQKLASSTDTSNPFNLKGRDKETRAKLKYYGQLFYLIQTHPDYLARLMFSMNKKSGQNVTRLLENIILALYGYAQNTREDYLFVNLIKACIKIEIDDISSLSDFWKANPLFIRLLIFSTRGAKDRQFLRELLQPLVSSVLTTDDLSLETDPLLIYKNLIKEEESSTGEKSKRKYEVTASEAAEDVDVITIQLARFAQLQEITDQYINGIVGSIQKLPYGLRLTATFLQDILKKKFPGNDDEVSRIVGNLIYYRYLNPAIIAPEAFDVIDANVTSSQRKNLAEIAKIIHQSSTNRQYPADGTNLNKLNGYLTKSYEKLLTFFRDVATNVLSAEEYFCMDLSVDFAAGQKISIYISPNEILALHRNIIENLDDMAPDGDDGLREILNDLGTPPPEEAIQQSKEISLVLSNRFAKLNDADNSANLKKRLNETKRLVLAIIRIQSGKHLVEILKLPVTTREEILFEELQKQELERQEERREMMERKAAAQAAASRDNLQSTELLNLGSVDNLGSGDIADSKDNVGASTDNLSSNPLGSENFKSENVLNVGSNPQLYVNNDGKPMKFADLKKKVTENLIRLEEDGVVKKSNNYQDILNSIAKDMLNKHRRRRQRARELATLRSTLGNLDEKAKFLNDQIKSYHDYIDACISQQVNKKGKSKKPILFTKQYYHIKELQKSGKVPKFGSFKWTAEQLYKKGVLLSVDDYSPKQYKQITLTISSDEAGVFHVEASFLGISLPEKMEIRLEDLLQSQYNGVQVMTLFDMAKVNVNLLIFLINKKFYV